VLFGAGLLIQVIDPLGVDKGTAPLDSANGVALFQEELAQVCSVLARHTRNKRSVSRHLLFSIILQ